jgi:hypothetical protein
MIGLMRNGRILAEDRPEELFKEYNTNSFDNLYLKLCQIDNDSSQMVGNSNNNKRSTLQMAEWPLCEPRLSKINDELINFKAVRFFSFIKKNLYIMRGNLVLMLFFFIFPSLQLILFCSSFGKEVRHIPVAVFNPEKSEHLSRTFLRSLDTNMIEQYKYPTLDSAIEAVKSGQAWTAIAFSSNYSKLIKMIYISGRNLSVVNLFSRKKFLKKFFNKFYTQILLNHFQSQEENNSSVKLYIDLSNAVIGQQLIYSIIRSLKDFLSMISNKYLAKYSSPIVVEQVIYGSKSPTFMEFLAPGYIVAIVFLSSMLLTAYLLIKDQLNGLLERCLSTGASGLEVFLSHFITQLKLLIFQELLVLTVAFVIFKIPVRGPICPLLAIVFMQGVVGISFGLLISAICPNASSAVLLTSGE